MASNITVDTLTKGSTTLNTDEIVDTNSSQVCKAWVNFNGTGTVAINDSYNVSSITDKGTGWHGINFINSFADWKYAATVSARGSTNTGNGHIFIANEDTSSYASGGFDVRVEVENAYSTVDSPMINAIVFGD